LDWSGLDWFSAFLGEMNCSSSRMSGTSDATCAQLTNVLLRHINDSRFKHSGVVRSSVSEFKQSEELAADIRKYNTGMGGL
jgi:hypothetical protein